MLSLESIREHSVKLDLNLIGAVDCGSARTALSESGKYLSKWQSSGFAADMDYMKRDVELFTNPDNFLKNCKSILCFAVPYQSKHLAVPSKKGFGRVARYAWGLDYHKVIKTKLGSLVEALKAKLTASQQLEVRIFTDAVPLLERVLAAESKLGFIGNNSLLIRPGMGSYFFIAEVLLNVELDPEELRELKVPGNRAELDLLQPGQGCGTCIKCVDDCPTDAILANGVIDSNKCISYLTIEKRTNFDDWESSAIGDWIFGCDICQEVCPFNHEENLDFLSEFSSGNGVGPYLELKQVLEISDKTDFIKKFAKTTLVRAKREGLLRNACSVAANTHCFELVEQIASIAQYDSSDSLREHAHATLVRMSRLAEGSDKRKLLKMI